MLTNHYLVIHIWFFRCSRIISVNSNPMQFSTLFYLIFTNYRNIIFNITSNNTFTTTKTAVHINRHSPLHTFIIIKRIYTFKFMFFIMKEVSIFKIFINSTFFYDSSFCRKIFSQTFIKSIDCLCGYKFIITGNFLNFNI